MKSSQKYKVLCFSFAGGNQYSFDTFKKIAPDNITFITTDYPGRGTRIGENLLCEVNDLVEDMYQQIDNEIDSPYIIYGHSMGGLISYLLVLKLRSKGKKLPESIFITGCRAPSTWDKMKRLKNLNYEEFIMELKMLGGIPHEILNDKDSMLFFEPILRADFSIVATSEYKKVEPLSIPIKIITGTKEDISQEDALKWQEETTFPLSYNRLEGGHFFIFDHPEKILEEMSECFQNRK